MSEEQTSLMDELTAAWEEHEDAEIHENAPDESPSEPENDAAGGESVGGGEPAGGEQVSESGLGLNHEQSPEVQSGEAATVEPAPRGLSPAMRDHWKTLDSQTQAEFKRYEDRIAGMAQKYANDARRAQAMDKVMQPYSQLMAMNGGPQNILPGLLQTGAALQTGNEVERARTVAGLINQFKINPAQVADFLKGTTPNPSPEDHVAQLVNKQLQPMQKQLQQYQMREQQMRQQGQQQIKSELENFAQANEFYADVRESMADVMDIAVRNGREMTLQQAYDAACWQNPEIRKILTARQSQGQVQQRKRAASSIHGTPSGEGSSSPPADLRSALEQAWQTSNRM